VDPRDVVLAILLLNEKLGRRLTERGVKKIAAGVGVDNAMSILHSLREERLIDDTMKLTERGIEEAQEAIKRLEREVKKGFLGTLKWLNFKTKLAPQRIPKGGCIQGDFSD